MQITWEVDRTNKENKAIKDTTLHLLVYIGVSYADYMRSR